MTSEGKKNAMFRSLRKLKQLKQKLPPVFSASLANVKKRRKEKKIHKEKRRWYLSLALSLSHCVSLRISSSYLLPARLSAGPRV